MYLGPSCYGYALNYHLVYLAIPGTRPLYMKRQNVSVLFICHCQKRNTNLFQINMKQVSYIKIVSEYDQEIPQSKTADNPVAPRGKAAQPSRDTRKTN